MKKLKWTQAEDNLIKTNYPLQGPDLELSGRTRVAIKNRAQQLGVYFRTDYSKWSEEELCILKEFYPIIGLKVKSKLQNRTIKNIQVTAHRLGIKKNKKEAK